METFLGLWFIGSVAAALWGWKKYDALSGWQKTCFDVSVDFQKRWHLSEKVSAEWQTKYENLVVEIQKKVLTGSQPKPQNQVRKAKSYAEIRKLNEAAIREEETLESRREADTAYQE